MTQPHSLPMWILKDKEPEDEHPFVFIYRINSNLFMIEWVDAYGEIRSGPKGFNKMSFIKAEFFESECFDIILYNPGQDIHKHENFLMSVRQPNNNTPNNELVNEDPSSEDSEEPTSE
jgi:hypothetical protein